MSKLQASVLAIGSPVKIRMRIFFDTGCISTFGLLTELEEEPFEELHRKKTEISSLKEQTMTASEENKRLEKLSEEIEKMKVLLSFILTYVYA